MLKEEADRIVRLAKSAGKTLVTAESCTGGALASLLADAPGAGEIFHGGFVVYTKANKIAALGVPVSLIETHSAVSAEVAEALAAGALERSPADLAISVTGVAGPEPDEDGNPVGLVYLGLADRDGNSLAEEHRFEPAAKAKICEDIVAAALGLLGKTLIRKAVKD